jgi:Uma2 family endonuclease
MLRPAPRYSMLMATPIALPMAMPSLVPKYTIDDLERFPDDGNRYELVDGFLFVTPAPLLPHELLCSSLATELNTAARSKRACSRVPARSSRHRSVELC